MPEEHENKTPRVIPVNRQLAQQPNEHVHGHQYTSAVVHRLSRAIGHLESVKTMVENGRDCSEVLIQLAAARGALNAISRLILKDHMEHCIVDAIEQGDSAKLEELHQAIDQILR